MTQLKNRYLKLVGRNFYDVKDSAKIIRSTGYKVVRPIYVDWLGRAAIKMEKIALKTTHITDEIYADKMRDLLIELISKTSFFPQHIEYRDPMSEDRENLEQWHEKAIEMIRERDYPLDV